MHRVKSFAPLAQSDARVLILGSMPGVASLVAGQYYAHARNAFWSLQASLFGFNAGLPYVQRVAALLQAGVAVWDVLQSCVRQGSLDADIARDSEVANDFTTFFPAHPQIGHVFFNGAAAEAAFRRHVWPALSENETGHLQLIRLPSTSPANAALSFERKLALWRTGLTAAGLPIKSGAD